LLDLHKKKGTGKGGEVMFDKRKGALNSPLTAQSFQERKKRWSSLRREEGRKVGEEGAPSEIDVRREKTRN